MTYASSQLIVGLENFLKDLDSRLLKDLESQYHVLDNTIIHDRNRSTFAHKIGRMAGHTKNFFSKPETKEGTLIAYWAFETLFYMSLVASLGSLTAFFIIFPIWAYGTYSLFGVITNQER